jgi:energy-coupling factor transporter ATP-binding protein EcfA2
MLKRIYIDNYKCLVNFETQVGPLNLFLGENGMGKSTIFDALRLLQAFISGEGKTDDLFSFTDRCRWQNVFLQTFELDIENPETSGLFRYRLLIDHAKDGESSRVKEEHLSYQDQPLFGFEMGEAQLYHDDHTEGPKYPFDWSRSGLASLYPRPDNQLLTWFKNQMNKMVIAQIIPATMKEETGERGDILLSRYFENFASWYKAVSQDQGLVNRLINSLRETIDNFDSFKFASYGERYLLQTRFYYDSLQKGINYKFGELSDGQRMLIALYTLLEASQDNNYILCLDEPENFVSLPEIQPWLNTLREQCDGGKTQAILISHHPELIDLLASQACWFERPNGLATRIKPLPDSIEGDLRISELIARGWLNNG